MPSLKSIDLSNCAHFWNHELAPSLIDFIGLQENIEELDLSGNRFEPFATNLLFDRLLDSEKICKSLRKLDLNGSVRIENSSWEKLANFMIQAPQVAN